MASRRAKTTEMSAAQAKAWREAWHAGFQIGINKSPVQFLSERSHHTQPDWVAHLRTLGLAGDALAVEITEGLLLERDEAVAARLRALRAAGMSISLDDFGTGYSSLSSLSRLPIDVVKVDRSFVRDVTADAQDVSVTRAIIHMTHGLQMRALAEGVETEGQLSLLVAAGCDEVQGYWFSPALTAAALEAMLRSGHRLPERYIRRPSGGRPRTLLLVDDEENILKSLQRVLRRPAPQGLRPTAARSAPGRPGRHQARPLAAALLLGGPYPPSWPTIFLYAALN